MSDNTLDLDIGKVYNVDCNDCRVCLTFTSRLVAANDIADNADLGVKYGLLFENGVNIIEWIGCKFEEEQE